MLSVIKLSMCVAFCKLIKPNKYSQMEENMENYRNKGRVVGVFVVLFSFYLCHYKTTYSVVRRSLEKSMRSQQIVHESQQSAKAYTLQ